MIFNLMLLAICIFFVLRTVVILAGWWKEPILRQFRAYGGERRFYPLAQLCVWMCASLLSLAITLYPRRTPSIILLGGLALLFVVMWTRNYPETSRALLDRLPIYPLWYRRLREYTSRFERRRIGYLWLRLPGHLRALLNRHDAVFMQWADFVIMGAVLEEDHVNPEQFEKSYLEQTLYER
jgi:hypothetical protein